jgi:long-chain fatty acid transport protein
MRSHTFLTFVLVLGVLVGALPRQAHASGFYLMERGVRALGRGGAYVAGAQGAESLWINPAGLKGSGNSFRMEGNLTLFRASFERIDDAGTTRPSVDLGTAKLPIPLFGLTKDFGLEDFTFGFSVYAPSFAVYDWPSSVDGGPAANRYSLYSLKGSIFGNIAAGVAWHGLEGLSLGFAATLITGRFKDSMALSACDGFVCVHPEDPSFDATTTITVRRFATVMVGGGLTYEAGPVKFGASAQTPWNIKGNADVDVKLPSDPLFANASLDGNEAKIKVPFPWVGRVGLEFKASESFKMEVAAVYEAWSAQQQIVAKSSNMWIRDVVGIGDYQVGTIKIQRLMSDAYSLRGGFEYFMEEAGITLRMGASYDTTAVKDKALTPLLMDANKIVAGLGLTIHVGSVFDFDMVYGHIFMPDRQIRNSEITQPTAIRPPLAPADQSHIGNGNYTMEADFVGIGSTFHL